MHLARLAGILKHRQGCEQHMSLSLTISRCSHRPPIWVLDGGRAGNANRPVEFGGRGEHDRAKTLCFKIARSQSHGLAAERSGRCEQGGGNPLVVHASSHGRNRLLYELGALPLKPVEGV